MKKLLAISIILIFTLTSCKKDENKIPDSNLPAGTHAVKVLDFMDVSNYTYLHVSENGNEYWIAAPQMKAEKDETLYYSQGMEMKNFHSDVLNRTFPSVYFVQSISPNLQQGQTLSSVHQQVNSSQRQQISVEHLTDGKTVSQIYSGKDELSGKIIKICGKVVKYNPGIMSRNWIHIQDGTESNGNFDMLITSKDEAALGQTIIVEGRVVLNKDFGAGYSYSVLVEDAKILSAKPM
ncbi:MAG: hypothetical protein WCA84_00305 [Ignavibacteriaceae bacterium]|jgi:hypothetical protein